MADKKLVMEQNITQTLEINYMPYAMSVIVSRAIPDIDGFKPAHRKLLYTMYKMGLISGTRTKSTNVVGQTMKLNPHGDATIYETLVRLTRGHDAVLHPFIDSKGNFGKQYSRDMAYAASRYTEVKLDSICNEIFRDIDKDTVDFIDNYDGSLKEPVLFPTAYPNILVTPNQGIAVSMASTLCSFNLKEVCSLTINYIKNKNIDVKKYLKAPDFSTGGELIYNEEEIDRIYNTGRGSLQLRGKYKYDKKNNLIEIYEIPYSTTIEVIIDKVIALVKQNKIKEINDIRNETDLSGLKIAIDIKKNANPDILMSKIFSMTSLSDKFSCNFNVLINGVPKTLGIKQILDEWIIFRINCIKRQTIFDLKKKNEKYHLLTGLSKIILDIDKAVNIIRNTEEESQVISNLCIGFDIDEIQAEFVAEMKLRNINKEYLLKRISERNQIETDIKELERIRDDEELIKDIIIKQLKEISKKYGIPRKTEIIYEDNIVKIDEEELIEDYAVKLFLTKHNYFKKISISSLRYASEHKLKEDDEIVQEIAADNKMDLLLFSDKFNVYKTKIYELAECKAKSLGEYLNNVIDMAEDERIIYIVATNNYTGYMIFGYENGKVSKIPLSSYMTKVNRKRLINAYSNKAALTGIFFINDDEDFMAIRDNDKAMLFNSSLITEKALKNSSGIQIYNLKKGSIMSKLILKNSFVSNDYEYFRTDKVPCAGHFIRDTEKFENKLY